jgi:hypothetical protein
MPATSEKQKRFMDAAAHNPAFAKAAGVPVSVAKDFSEASKGLKFGKGAPKARADLQKVNKPETLHGKMSVMKEGGDTMNAKMKMFEKSGKDVEKKGMKEGSKADMALDKKQMMGMKKGGITTAKMGAVKSGGNKGKGEHAIQSKGLSKGTMVKMGASKPLGMKKGGKTMAYGGKC